MSRVMERRKQGAHQCPELQAAAKTTEEKDRARPCGRVVAVWRIDAGGST